MSQNVLTRIEPSEETHQRAVLLTHLDTNRCRIAWQSSTVQYLEPMTYLTLSMLLTIGGLYFTGAIFGGPAWVWWISLFPAAYIFANIVFLWVDDHTPYSPGANDNAASVAIALELGAHLRDQPLQKTQVWLAFTGAEETDHADLYELLREYDTILRQAIFIGLEGVGSGELVYLTRQGLCFHYRPDPALLRHAENIAARYPELEVSGARMTMEDEVGTLRRHGYQAICIAGRDPATGTLPHWHRPDDVAEKVSTQSLERALNFVIALLFELDRKIFTEEEQ
jgi:hypothetical protein